MKSYDGDKEELSINSWNDVTIDSALFCFVAKNKTSGCSYVLVLKTTTMKLFFKVL